MSTAKSGTTVASNRIDFIYKYKTRSVLSALFEHVTNASGTDTYEHFNEIRSADAEKRYVRFSGHGLGKQSLSRTRGTNHENSLGDFSTDFPKTLGIF